MEGKVKGANTFLLKWMFKNKNKNLVFLRAARVHDALLQGPDKLTWRDGCTMDVIDMLSM